MKENGWPIKSLAELCTLRPPKAEARKRLSMEAAISFVPMEDLGIDEKHPKPIQTRMLGDVQGSYTYFADGDVLLAKVTPCFQNGKLGIAKGLSNGVGFGSSEFFVLRSHAELHPEYLYYFLSRADFREEGVKRMGGAVGLQRVPPEFVLGERLPLPPLPEQQRIVDILDEAFAGIATAKANAEKNLRNARELFESERAEVLNRGGIRRKGKVPKNGSVFFTIFQTFMCGPPRDGHRGPRPAGGDWGGVRRVPAIPLRVGFGR